MPKKYTKPEQIIKIEANGKTVWISAQSAKELGL